MRPSFYQPSSRIPALRVLAFLCSLAGAGLGAFFYALASVSAPGYVNAFLTLAYAHGSLSLFTQPVIWQRCAIPAS